MSSVLANNTFGAHCGALNVEGVARDIALEHAQDVLPAVTLLTTAVGEVAGSLVVDRAVVSDGPKSVVGLTVAAAGEPVALPLSAADLDGAGSAERGEKAASLCSRSGVASGYDQQLCGAVDADTRTFEKAGYDPADEVTDHRSSAKDLLV